MSTPTGEHIFPATEITELALKWKDAVATGAHKTAEGLLEVIVKKCEPMFRRFAQHERFDHTVDLDRLVNVAMEKVVKWLQAWDSKGRLFSWFTVCCKNAFRSEANKETAYKRRFHVTSDNLEQFFGSEDHAIERAEAIKAARGKLQDMTSRWGSKQEIGTLGYLFAAITDPDHNKPGAIRGATYAFGLDPDMVKFFYNWALMELRSAFYTSIRVPFSEQDLVRAYHSYTYLPDLLNIITFPQFKQMVAVMGGTRLRIPTLSQMVQMKEKYELYVEADSTDLDPASIEAVGKKRGKSGRSAQEIYEEAQHSLAEGRTGEFPVFDEEAQHHDPDNDAP